MLLKNLPRNSLLSQESLVWMQDLTRNLYSERSASLQDPRCSRISKIPKGDPSDQDPRWPRFSRRGWPKLLSFFLLKISGWLRNNMWWLLFGNKNPRAFFFSLLFFFLLFGYVPPEFPALSLFFFVLSRFCFFLFFFDLTNETKPGRKKGSQPDFWSAPTHYNQSAQNSKISPRSFKNFKI